MIRRITLVQKIEGLSEEDFFSHWINQHASIGRQLEGLLGYRLNPIISKPTGCQWNGVAESWFETIDAANNAFSQEPLRSKVINDSALFIGKAVSFFVDSIDIIPPPS